MPENIKKYTSDELFMEAECVEEYGEWIHLDLMGYSADELRAFAELKK